MTIDLIQKSEASKIDIFGFDFFESLSNSGRRGAKQVPHDFNSEKKFVKNLINFDKRIKYTSFTKTYEDVFYLARLAICSNNFCA